MDWDPDFRPQLRPLQAVRLSERREDGIAVCDPGGLSDVMLTLPNAALLLMTMMDGHHTCEEIREKFYHTVGQLVSRDSIHSLLEHLESAHFLEGPTFESHYRALQDEYRSNPVRQLPLGSALASLENPGASFDEMLAQVKPMDLPGPVCGLIAPHLDYPRGRPCYAKAYATLRDRPAPDRVIILGTNHFSRSVGVVATKNHFSTPLGVTHTEVFFIEQLEARCGDLRTHELDHAREHSIELQVAWLQHLFGPDKFAMAPFLCPDPCGPTDAAADIDPGVNLRAFATALGELIAASPGDTLIVAGADLSHVGPEFGDERSLDDVFLKETEEIDQRALAQLVTDGPEGWLRSVGADHNPTRICSAGCVFALAMALPHASASVLEYHQAVDPQSRQGVTCAAVAFT
jgi:AmmeMemoRadiSam system protein B